MIFIVRHDETGYVADLSYEPESINEQLLALELYEMGPFPKERQAIDAIRTITRYNPAHDVIVPQRHPEPPQPRAI